MVCHTEHTLWLIGVTFPFHVKMILVIKWIVRLNVRNPLTRPRVDCPRIDQRPASPSLLKCCVPSAAHRDQEEERLTSETQSDHLHRDKHNRPVTVSSGMTCYHSLKLKIITNIIEKRRPTLISFHLVTKATFHLVSAKITCIKLK